MICVMHIKSDTKTRHFTWKFGSAYNFFFKQNQCRIFKDWIFKLKGFEFKVFFFILLKSSAFSICNVKKFTSSAIKKKLKLPSSRIYIYVNISYILQKFFGSWMEEKCKYVNYESIYFKNCCTLYDNKINSNEQK